MSWLSLHSYFFTLNEGIGSEEGDIFLAFLPLQSVATVLFVISLYFVFKSSPNFFVLRNYEFFAHFHTPFFGQSAWM